MTELLVLVGIIGLLLAIAFPAFVAVRRSMVTMTCAANLRQIGQALTAYRATFRYWPEARYLPVPLVPMSIDSRPPIYDLLAANLLPNSEIYRCRADRVVWPEVAAASSRGFGISYAYYNIDKLSGFTAQDKARFPLMTDVAGGSMTWTVNPPHSGNVVNRLQTDGSVEAYEILRQ